MSGLDHRIPPPLVMLGVAALMAPALWLEPPRMDVPLRWVLTALFFFFAALFGPFAVRAFVKAKTTIDPVHLDKPAALVTSGVFRLTRNPMYMSMVLLLCAWACALARSSAVLGPIAFVLYINRFQIRSEERALIAIFGKEYAQYKAKVRRWI